MQRTNFNAVLAATMMLSLAACAGLPETRPTVSEPRDEEPVPVLPNIALFEPTASAPEPDELLMLTPEQERAFLDWYRAPRRSDEPGHHRLRDYLLSHLNGFDYYPETLSPAEALRRHEGNCMSLAALTYSLSRLVGIEHSFQLVNTPPIFDRQSNVVIGSDHVRSRLYNQANEVISRPGGRLLRRPYVLLDYFAERPGLSGSLVSDEEFLVMYYHNLAAEAYVDGEVDRAFTLAREVLVRDPDNPNALNLMALLHRRKGDTVTAEALYNYVTEVHGLRPDVLNNHANMLRQQGRDEEAEVLEWRLTELDDANPFHWIALGQQARERGQLELALQWFEVAIDRAPYLDEAYWRAAVVHHELGRDGRSSEYLRTALDMAESRESRERYRGKLRALNGFLGAGTSP